MLGEFYRKSKIWFAVTWIVIYCVTMSVGDLLSAKVGIEKSVTLAFGIVLSTVLLLFMKTGGLFKSCGICRPKVSGRSMLYYIPVLVMLSANLWQGVTLNYGALETVLYILSMFCVGFLEEVIFRAFLFDAMRKDNLKAAVVVSSITFGFGHIINLINGSGADLVSNLLQVIYATAAGFMFVMLYYKTKSLLVCIVSHGVFNALSVFANDANETVGTEILSGILLTVITGSYAVYIALTVRGKNGGVE